MWKKNIYITWDVNISVLLIIMIRGFESYSQFTGYVELELEGLGLNLILRKLGIYILKINFIKTN